MQTKEFYNISHFGVKCINFCLCSKNVITNYRECILISFTRNHSSRVELSFRFIFQPYTCCSTTIYGYLLYFLVHIILYGFCIDSDGKSTFKSLGSSQGNICLRFLLFWFQYCLSLQKIKPLYTTLKRGGGGGEQGIVQCTRPLRGHMQPSMQMPKELEKLNLQNDKIIINIVFVSTKFNMFMFVLFVCLLVQFADMCSFLLKQMRFTSCTLLDSAET